MQARHRRHGFDPWVGEIPRRQAQQPTPVFLPGESHGQRSLEGYSPSRDLQRVRHDWCDLAFTPAILNLRAEISVFFFHGSLEFSVYQSWVLLLSWNRFTSFHSSWVNASISGSVSRHFLSLWFSLLVVPTCLLWSLLRFLPFLLKLPVLCSANWFVVSLWKVLLFIKARNVLKVVCICCNYLGSVKLHLIGTQVAS